MEKMYSKFYNWGPLLLLLFYVTACTKENEDTTNFPKQDSLIVKPTPYVFPYLPGFPKPFVSANNPLTIEGVELGKKLYSDPILSSNGRSCSSCHNKERSYSFPMFYDASGAKISVPPHLNLAFKSRFNWEGSVTDLDTLCMGDFEPGFFNTKASDLYIRLSSHPEYPLMFQKAFGITNFNLLSYYDLKVKICYAITQYMRTLVSASSRYDTYIICGQPLTPEESAGKDIFFSERGDCFHCHVAPLFNDNNVHNNGLSDQYSGFDLGYFRVTGKETDKGKFVTPTLRNIALTAPYMHDGRFQTLEEVVEFYNSGVKLSANTDPIMSKRHLNTGLNLTSFEQKQLVAFLRTLTDTSFVK